MNTQLWFEIVGYLASLLVAISLMMSSILRLRIINLVGALVFSVYGLLIRAYPVAALNFFIVLIDLYYLVEMLRTREYFRLLVVQPESEYLGYFLRFYGSDIRKFQPGASFEPQPGQLVLFILRNMVPTGLVLGDIRDGDSFYVHLDYAIPGYRDLRTGRFVYQDQAQAFLERGIRKIYTAPGALAHARYLRRMGFQPASNAQGQELLCLSLSI